MTEKSKSLETIFLEALEIDSREARATYLERECGADSNLRQEVERLLKSNDEVGSFLERPALEEDVTLAYAPPSGDRAVGLNAGLTAAFDARQAVVMGRPGHSVLKAFEEAMSVPRVALREPTNQFARPVVPPSSSPTPAPASDSRYQVQGEIARGGMGAILKGRDTDLGRDLAIKVLLDEHKAKPEVVQRFIEEAQIGGQLQHPGIVPVYELGQFADRRPFFSMKLVKGETLAKFLSDRTDLATDRAKFLGIFEQVCQTMAYSHSRGVIHRDLKPANIMVGAFGEVQVMDWGLAKVLVPGGSSESLKPREQLGLSSIRTLRQPSGDGSDASGGSFGSAGSQTQMGSVMGTPAYMPPEQALGEIDALDERADVFGLGAILCEILTGKPPYVNDNTTVVYRMATRGQLTACYERLASCGADEELVAIARQCLSPEPRDRPRDAAVLAERIGAYLESVETRLRTAELERAAEAARAAEALHTVAETEARARAEQRTRRLQLMVAVFGLIAVSLGGLAAFSSSVYQRKLADEARDAREKAEELRGKAEESRRDAEAAAAREQEQAMAAREAQRREATMRSLAEEREQVTQATLYAAEMNLATQAAEFSSGLRRVKEITANWQPDRVTRDLRGWEWYYLDALTHAAQRTFAHEGAIGMRWSPDGQRFTTYGRDTKIRGWDNESGNLLFESTGHTSYVYDVAWNPAGTRFVSVGRDHMLRFWDGKTGQPAGTVDLGSQLYFVRWSPDGRRLAVKSENDVIVLSAENHTVERRWAGGLGERSVAWHPNSERLAVYGAVYDVKTGEQLWAHEGTLVDWSPDGSRLAICQRTFSASILSGTTGQTLLDLKTFDSEIDAISWHPHGEFVAFGVRDSSVWVWNGHTGNLAALLRGHERPARDVSWRPDGKQLASTSYDSVNIWDWPVRENPAKVTMEHRKLTNLYWSADGQSLLGCGDHVEFWGVDTLRLRSSLPIGDNQINHLFSPSVTWCEKAHLIAGSNGATIRLIDDRTGEQRLEIPFRHKYLRSLVLNPSGTRLAASYFEPSGMEAPDHCYIAMMDTATGDLLWEFTAHGDLGGGMAWSGDGKTLACAGWIRVEFLNADDGKLLKKNIANYESGWIHEMCWSPDGEKIALGHLNHVVRIIDLKTAQEVLKLVGHSGGVRAISWSPDGRRLATGSDDRTVRVWNAQTGHQVMSLRQHGAAIESVAWSPDGKQLASGTLEGEIRIWAAGGTFPAAGDQPSGSSDMVQDAQLKSLGLTPMERAERELARLASQLTVTPQNETLVVTRANLLARLGRWSESATAFEQLTKLQPTNRYGWGVAATPMLMAGEPDRYRAHCRALLEQFPDAPSADIADTICKTALLLPDTIPLKSLPVQKLRDGIKDPTWEAFRPWFVACSALIAYREGQPQEAIRWAMQMPDFRSQPGCLALVVRAMAEHQLEQHEAARASLKAAELLIPTQLRVLGAPGDSTPLPVPEGIVDHDWLVPEILRREAERLLKSN